MSYEIHPSCKTPKDKSLKIWRYMDFTKFVAMLEDKALFFANISSLTDSFEGFLTKPTVNQFLSVPEDVGHEEAARRRKVGEYNLGVMKRCRNLLYVSAWHMNEHESAAMWKLYLKSDEGVAIQSTVANMIDSFNNTQEKVHIGQIEYVDYENVVIDWKNILSAAMYKRKSYEHEKELRAIIMSGESVSGKLVATDVNVLIDRVHVAPNSQKWYYELVKKTVKRYGLDKKVIDSALDQTPLY
jgi:hypothetical protein